MRCVGAYLRRERGKKRRRPLRAHPTPRMVQQRKKKEEGRGDGGGGGGVRGTVRVPFSWQTQPRGTCDTSSRRPKGNLRVATADTLDNGLRFSQVSATERVDGFSSPARLGRRLLFPIPSSSPACLLPALTICTDHSFFPMYVLRTVSKEWNIEVRARHRTWSQRAARGLRRAFFRNIVLDPSWCIS